MDPLFGSLQGDALLLGLMLIRVSAMVATAPVLSSRSIPVRVKAAIGLALVLSVLPMTAAQTGGVPQDGFAYLMLAGKELIIGAAIGLIAQMVFAAVQMAGAFIDLSTGFAMASALDPVSSSTMTVLGRTYNLIATTVFVTIGGHLMLLKGVLASFTLIPPTAMPRFEVFVQGVASTSAGVFVIALQLAAPLMAALLITDVALGIMSRAAPQMNVFATGLPIKIGIGLVGSAFLMSAFVAYFTHQADIMIDTLSAVLTGAR